MNQPTDLPAECAARKALEACKDQVTRCSSYDCYKGGHKDCAYGLLNAALATPCQHGSEQNEIARLRAEGYQQKSKVLDLERQIRNDRIETQHELTALVQQRTDLTAELAEARKATEEAQAERDEAIASLDFEGAKAIANHAQLVIDDLTAELRRAVDALRQLITPGVYEPSEEQAAREIVAAYDAKHGNVCNIE